MSIENLLLLNEKIAKCDERKDNNCRCKGSKDATPLVDTPEKTQSFMLITRDPSNNANNVKVLVGRENSFFVNHIIPLFYRNYDLKKAKKSEHYFSIFQKHFHENIYWTHYAKCFPGINAKGKKGHKTPNVYCANQFLLKEIEEFNPKHLVLIGDDTINFLTGKKTKDLIDNIVVRTLTLHEKEYNYLFSTHPSEANAYKGRYKFNDTKIKIQSIYEKVIDLPHVSNITEDILDAIFDCVYSRSGVSKTTQKIFESPNNIHLFDEIDLLSKEIHTENNFDKFQKMYNLSSPILGPFEVNSEGTSFWMSRCIALKEIFTLDDFELTEMLEKVKIRK